MKTEYTETVRTESSNHISQIPVFPTQRYPGYRAGAAQPTQVANKRSQKGELFVIPCAITFGYLTAKALRKLMQ